MSWADGETVF